MMQRTLAVLFCVLLSLSPGAQAKGFVFTDSTGKKLTLADYKGKWVLINFWATWCPPCLKEIPDLVSLYESRKDVMVIGIAMDYQNPKTVLKFVDSLSISYPIVLGDRKIAAQIGPVSMLPTTYLFDPAGQPAAYKVGLISRESIEEFMRENSPDSQSQRPDETSQRKRK
ncbi:thiol-disulfide isomerase/thioredoxin [Nitrosospira sp. Nsp5]|uniref:Thiol-disulfide isomerase or thioredoxin n=2 Tax=Nitrosomonadaceae TaxID=206379 RepID=A0ABY0T9D5_9PROT|nr:MULTISPECIES: TlpA disulfide reductase family protein [Nitrosospira]PTR07952.1 thiol-disulfide isomerase/thioredoxin [Nitrosospira sp. Nsp5]SDQ45188.1 Thiol-disulfide isomerase or thioredoxin [Nitrosospira multiformis]